MHVYGRSVYHRLEEYPGFLQGEDNTLGTHTVACIVFIYKTDIRGSNYYKSNFRGYTRFTGSKMFNVHDQTLFTFAVLGETRSVKEH